MARGPFGGEKPCTRDWLPVHWRTVGLGFGLEATAIYCSVSYRSLFARPELVCFWLFKSTHIFVGCLLMWILGSDWLNTDRDFCLSQQRPVPTIFPYLPCCLLESPCPLCFCQVTATTWIWPPLALPSLSEFSESLSLVVPPTRILSPRATNMISNDHGIPLTNLFLVSRVRREFSGTCRETC